MQAANNGKPSLKSATKFNKPRARAVRRHTTTYRNPRLTINTSLPVLLFVGILFTSVGFVVLYVFRNSEEVVVDYTYCRSVINSSLLCTDVVGKSYMSEKCWCEVPFRIENEMKEPVFLFYGLIVLYRVSHRESTVGMVKGLAGDKSNRPEPLPSDQVPVRVDDHTQTNGNTTGLARSAGKPNLYAVLTDTLTLFSVDQSMYVRLNQTGAAWPDMRCGRCSRHFPMHVQKTRTNSSRSESRNQNQADIGLHRFENEDFMVWMQPIASSTFQKLYRQTNCSTFFNGSLPKGNYQLLVTYTYPVTFFGGGKSLIVANSTVLGAKNRLLGVAFVATGSVCLIISMIFCAIRFRKKIIRKKEV